MIPKEHYDALPDEVKDILRQQHAYYREKIKALQRLPVGKPPPTFKRSINHTTISPQAELDDLPLDNFVSDASDTTPVDTQEQSNDAVMTTFQQFLARARNMNICSTSKVFHVPSRAIHSHFARERGYGRLISDNAADTGSLTPTHCHIIHTSQQQVLVNGCHPTLTKAYFLASGVTAIDLPTGPILVGQHEVPLIPESEIMLVSETQARCFGIDIDSKSRRFGGRGSIIFDDDTTVPLQLEHALMTCPI